METRIGNQRFYENFGIGAAKHPTNDKEMYLVFTDKDNEVVHMFPMVLADLPEYIDLLNQTKTAHKLHIAGAHEMPKGA